MKKIKFTTRTWLIIAGLLLMVLGIVCICTSAATLYSTAWIVGIFTLLAGIAELVFSFRATKLPGKATWILASILQILIGLIFLGNGLFVKISRQALFIIWVLVEGVIIIIQSYDFKKAGFHWWYLILALGFVTAGLGLILLVITLGGALLSVFGLHNPEVSDKILAVLVGISLIFMGAAYALAVAGFKKLEYA